RLPSVPEHLLKAVVEYQATARWSLALGARAASGVYLRGDEANLNPKTASYVAFDLSSRYRFTDWLALFATIAKLFDAKYATFGTLSATRDAPIAEVPGASTPRSLAPAPPFSVFAGLRVRL